MKTMSHFRQELYSCKTKKDEMRILWEIAKHAGIGANQSEDNQKKHKDFEAKVYS